MLSVNRHDAGASSAAPASTSCQSTRWKSSGRSLSYPGGQHGQRGYRRTSSSSASGFAGRELVRRDGVQQQLLRRRLAVDAHVDVPGLVEHLRRERAAELDAARIAEVRRQLDLLLERLPLAVGAEARAPAYRDPDEVVGQRQLARALVAEPGGHAGAESELVVDRDAPRDADGRVGRDRAQLGVGVEVGEPLRLGPRRRAQRGDRVHRRDALAVPARVEALEMRRQLAQRSRLDRARAAQRRHRGLRAARARASRTGRRGAT